MARAGWKPGTPYYSPRRGGLRLIRARRSASAPRGARPQGRKRRARRGSVDQPINGRLVRAASLLVLGPLLLLALTIGAAGPVSRLDAAALVRRPLGRGARDRAGARLSLPPARLGRRRGSSPVGEGQARPLRPHRRRGQLGREHPRSRPRPAAEPRHGRARARRTTRSSSSPTATTRASGPGANDNASGTAALIELARGYGRLGTVAGRPTPQHTLIFLSSDGGAYGGFGAERFASTSPYRDRIKAVVSLDGLAGSAEPRLELAGFEPRSPAPALIRTADVQVAAQLGRPPARAGWLVQLVDLGMPFGYGEQAPFLGRKISAIRLGDGAGRRRGCRQRHARAPQLDALSPPRAGLRVDPGVARRRHRARRGHGGARLPGEPHHPRLGDRARSADGAGPVPRRARSTCSPAAGAGGCRCAGAWRALRTRFGVWLWIGLLVGLGALAGVFPRGSAIPPPPGSAGGQRLARCRARRPRAARGARLVAGAPGAGPGRSRRR